MSNISIDDAIKRLERIERNLSETEINRVLDELSSESVSIAQRNFSQAEYDGDNDVSVSREVDGNKATIRAEGNATLFIEYGSGVVYGGEETEQPQDMVLDGRGQYGMKRGSNPKGWFYRGNQGTNGEESYIREGLIHTYGNPSNACMYNARKETRELGEEKLKEVFK